MDVVDESKISFIIKTDVDKRRCFVLTFTLLEAFFALLSVATKRSNVFRCLLQLCLARSDVLCLFTMLVEEACFIVIFCCCCVNYFRSISNVVSCGYHLYDNFHCCSTCFRHKLVHFEAKGLAGFGFFHVCHDF